MLLSVMLSLILGIIYREHHSRGGGSLHLFRRKSVVAVFILFFILSVGTWGYLLISNFEASILDCLYMTIITIASVGYEEVIDLSASPAGRMFTIFLILVGILCYMYFISSFTAIIVEGKILKKFRRKRMEQILENYNQHYILCGCGDTGRHIAKELWETGRKVVLIDSDPATLSFFDGIGKPELVYCLVGDATEDEILIRAGIKKAQGVFVCLKEDKDNLLVTFAARNLNISARIVSRCTQQSMHEKLQKAGANAIISPNFIGGMRMASEMVRPAAVSFLDRMLRDKEKNLRVEDVAVPSGSKQIGKSLGELDFWNASSLFPIAIESQSGSIFYNPTPNYILKEGDILVIIGNATQRSAVETLLKGK